MDTTVTSFLWNMVYFTFDIHLQVKTKFGSDHLVIDLSQSIIVGNAFLIITLYSAIACFSLFTDHISFLAKKINKKLNINYSFHCYGYFACKFACVNLFNCKHKIYKDFECGILLIVHMC